MCSYFLTNKLRIKYIVLGRCSVIKMLAHKLKILTLNLRMWFFGSFILFLSQTLHCVLQPSSGRQRQEDLQDWPASLNQSASSRPVRDSVSKIKMMAFEESQPRLICSFCTNVHPHKPVPTYIYKQTHKQ